MPLQTPSVPETDTSPTSQFDLNDGISVDDIDQGFAEPSEVSGIADQAVVNPDEAIPANQALTQPNLPVSSGPQTLPLDNFGTADAQALPFDSPTQGNPPSFNLNQDSAEEIDTQVASTADPLQEPGVPNDVSLENNLEQSVANLNRDNTVFRVERLSNKDASQPDKIFNFKLLPAIKTDNISGASLSMNDTPGATEGISILTKMRYKNKITPGGHPVVDAVGLESKVIRLVGRLTGYEDINDNASAQSDIPTASLSTGEQPPPNHSYDLARYFSRQIVERGGEVKIIIEDVGKRGPFQKNEPNPWFKIRFFGVIVNFQVYAVREDLTYYQMDCLATRYLD